MGDKTMSIRDANTFKLLVDMGNGSHGEVSINLTGCVIASDGAVIHPDSLSQALAYDGSGNLLTTTVTAPNGNTYVQTLTWTSGKLTGVSQWVKQ